MNEYVKLGDRRKEGGRIAPVSGLSQEEELRAEEGDVPLGEAVKEKRETKVKGENRPAE